MLKDNAKLMVITEGNKFKISVYVNTKPEYKENDIKFPFPFPTNLIYETIIDLPESCMVVAIDAVSE